MGRAERDRLLSERRTPSETGTIHSSIPASGISAKDIYEVKVAGLVIERAQHGVGQELLWRN